MHDCNYVEFGEMFEIMFEIILSFVYRRWYKAQLPVISRRVVLHLSKTWISENISDHEYSKLIQIERGTEEQNIKNYKNSYGMMFADLFSVK